VTEAAARGRPEWFIRSLAWLGLTAVWGGAAILALAVEANAAYRAPVILPFVLVCPGLALVRLLGIPVAAARLSLAIAVSLALAVLVPAALVYAGAWSPPAALAILAGLAITFAAVEVVLRRGGREELLRKPPITHPNANDKSETAISSVPAPSKDGNWLDDEIASLRTEIDQEEESRTDGS
jgi:hypothetical protein